MNSMDDAPVEPVPEPEPGATPTAVVVAPVSRVPAAGDAEAGGRVCEVALEEFEGPLDLLLHLVRRHELDVLNIPISFVCEKYLEYIEFMQALDLEVAGDYLVMAATLAYLKSRELVPQPDLVTEEGVEPGGPDPREQLIARLLEYQKFKDAARRLDQRPIAGRDTFARGQDIELPPLDSGLAPITLFRLAEAYSRVLERARIHRSHEVVLENISIASRMEQLTSLLIERSRFDFERLFLERSWHSEAELRSMLVVTLMSILELVRMGIARVHQPVDADTITVERVASEQEARQALQGYDESRSFGDGSGSSEAAEPGESAEAIEAVAEAETSAQATDEAVAAVAVAEAVVAETSAQATDEAVEAVEAVAEAVAAETSAQATDDAVVAEAAVDAGASAQSVVSESPAVDDDPASAGDVAPSPAVDDTEGSTEGDGQAQGHNGEAQEVEGS